MTDAQPELEHDQLIPDVARIRKRVIRYEQTYGIHSEDLRRAIDAQHIKKTPTVTRWLADYERLQEIEAPRPMSGIHASPVDTDLIDGDQV